MKKQRTAGCLYSLPRNNIITSPPVEVRSIAMSASVCLSVCLSVCPLAYLKNDMSKLYEIFCTCYL